VTASGKGLRATNLNFKLLLNMTMFLKAVYFPLQGEQGVSRFLLKYSNDSLVGPSTEDALHEEKVPYTPPLAYFKVRSSNPLRTCAKH
jgi:hypothetical protein